MSCTIRTRLTSFALAAAVATTSFGFATADSAEAASKRKTAVTKKAGKKYTAKASGRKIG